MLIYKCYLQAENKNRATKKQYYTSLNHIILFFNHKNINDYVSKNNLMLFSLLITLSISAQNELISPFLSHISQNQAATTFLLQKPETVSVKYINLDLNTLQNANTLQLTFDDQNYSVTNDSIVERGPQNYSWFGSNINGFGYIIISILGDEVQGIIRKDGESYQIFTTATNNQQVVVKIDQSQFPAENCIDNVHNPIPITNPSTGANVGCPIRALIMYTPAAESDLSGGGAMLTDVTTTIETTVAEMNFAFEQSTITNYPAVEIALIEKWNYTETAGSSMSTTKSNFKDNAYVNQLRDDYDADFAILIADDSGFYGPCGVADGLQVSRSKAFAVVANNCMQGYFSFAHELGHLLGAHHDAVNASNAPYPYAHGYVEPGKKWRTIMAYPCGSDCERLGFWSNPDVLHPIDNIPMDTDSLENNARVLRDYNNDFAQFEQPGTNLVINNSNYNTTNNKTAKLEVKQTISTNGNVNVNNDACLSMKAAQRVTVNKGFKSQAGATIHNSNQEFNNCE